MAYVAYTDGACKGNPGPGGWGVFLQQHGGGSVSYYGGEPDTTNNRMELQAAIEALQRVGTGADITVYTDSQYVQRGITTWVAGWKRKGWRTAANNPVKNSDQWRRLDALCSGANVEWRWVKAHAGNPGNEEADRLANKGITFSPH